MSRVGIAHHHSAITVGGAHPTATFLWAFVSQRLMTVHPKMPLLTHPHPDPPLEGEGNSLSLRERVRVRVGIFIPLCEPQGLMTIHSKSPFGEPLCNVEHHKGKKRDNTDQDIGCISISTLHRIVYGDRQGLRPPRDVAGHHEGSTELPGSTGK